MKRLFLAICCTALALVANAQAAKSVLDKAASEFKKCPSVNVTFEVAIGEDIDNGTITLQGNKFCTKLSNTSIWFDGKTMWTYVKDNEEVNVSNPSEAQLQAINPYNFINLYKSGYTNTLNSTGNAYVVHLTSTAKDQKIKELFITIDKQSYHPTKVKLLQGKSWTEFDISNLSKAKLADSEFRFNAKDFPKAEVIDLR